MTADFRSLHADYKKRIDAELALFLDDVLKRHGNAGGWPAMVLARARDFCLRGGKRLRPMLVVFGYQACGGKHVARVLKPAVAVELMEAFLLVHDDIIDRDELRRGFPTLHREFDTEHHGFGESLAIIAGDILSVLGVEAILRSDFPLKNRELAVRAFAYAVVETCLGQVRELELSLNKDVTEAEVSRLYEQKTAAYTFEAPLLIGAHLAGGSDEALVAYAKTLGRAFQLQDDILGLFGRQEVIGKPVGSDVREGKRTILMLKALARSDARQKAILESALGKDSMVEQVRSIIRETGALDATKQEAAGLAAEAKRIMESSGLKSPGKDSLVALADFVVRREY